MQSQRYNMYLNVPTNTAAYIPSPSPLLSTRHSPTPLLRTTQHHMHNDDASSPFSLPSPSALTHALDKTLLRRHARQLSALPNMSAPHLVTPAMVQHRRFQEHNRSRACAEPGQTRQRRMQGRNGNFLEFDDVLVCLCPYLPDLAVHYGHACSHADISVCIPALLPPGTYRLDMRARPSTTLSTICFLGLLLSVLR
ncbi:hypothetical protein BKA80DRAFT_143111 [Phyllosticta citrichinensis]